jgi:hypothetical protein
MRRRLASAFLPALILSVVLIAAPAQAVAPSVEGATATPSVASATVAASQTTVYRFWSPRNQSHFYTTSVAERDLIISTFPLDEWTYEGARYQAFTAQEPGTVPLYRFWSPTFAGHFYTSSEAEKNLVIDSYDDATWTFEGVAYYVYPTTTSVQSSIPVARFWSSKNRHHFYTADAGEAENVKTFPTEIWAYEGIDFRVPASVGLPIPTPPAQYVTPVVVTPPVVTPPVVTPPVVTPPSAYYANCSEVRAAGAAPLYRGQPGYSSKLDRDGDGVACE